MNLHAWIDGFTMRLSALLMPRCRYFSESVESASVVEHLGGVRLDMPDMHGEGEYQVVANTQVGKLSATIRVVQWRGREFPTVVYHHGTAESPTDTSLKFILPYHRSDIAANLILVQAPFHGSTREFWRGVARLDRYTAMVATSVHMVEAAVRYAREQGSPRVLVAGTSLGGFVANLHHARYNSAEVYVPIMAGAALGDALLSRAYGHVLSPRARRCPERIRKALNFEVAYAGARRDRGYPVLASHDQIVLYYRQAPCYDGRPILAIKAGHITGAFKAAALREHILGLLHSRSGTITSTLERHRDAA
jgi:pimeloyl-ACP methyl ester carboxylesterase